ncbi:ABC transporter substrate-binding protein [Halomonas saccharevitans]|uniref:Glycine betaine/proline transport system substrate-binding protein n=1 Tax=Halomonas saccharevitans TaxID=416872 RepID=A0A1I7BD37_9GAMM|nr:ABC transporter substrate-binding protein [Halomonas saccharevitans]SFT85077.1 glycine betaine/proline transport system substrate-binding protein [Halomonas saccharevitans]
MTKHHDTLRTGLLAAALGAVALPGLAQAEEVRFATPPWPGATVKTEVASQLLERLGYATSVKEASTAIILEGLVGGDIDVDMALWRPSQGGMLDPRLESGELVEVVHNIQGARFKLAVPGHVWDAGVRSMADLAEHADRFDHSLYGIEPGNVGNEIMQDAIDDDAYGLSDWRVVASSVTGMLSQLEANMDGERWTAFLGWEPHWMNVVYDVHYLEDPEGLWGDASSVSTVASAAFVERAPNVAAFLEQMVVPIEVQNAWVHAFSREERPLEAVAGDWLDANPERVGEWLEGVSAADGATPALEAYMDAYLADR